MNKTEKPHYPFSGFSPYRRRLFAQLVFMLFISLPATGQNKHMVQVKAFDQNLQPYRNVEVSVNGREFFPVNAKGHAFIELSDTDLPLKTVKIRNEELEAASWNYSKGVLEIIIRQKSYRMMQWVAKDLGGLSVPNLKVAFHGKHPLTATTDGEGRLQIPVSLDEEVQASLFAVNGYKIVKIHLSDKENFLIIEPDIVETTTGLARVKPESEKEYFKDFDLSRLDSIRSLTVFYAIFKNYEMKRLSAEAKKKVDAKFYELVTQLEDSAALKQSGFAGKISDSSFVSDDISNLLTQANQESKMLDVQREEFDEKIQLITEKIASSISKLNPGERTKLLSDIALLERLLINNESRFYKNHRDYRQLINSLKDRFFDVEDLETRLSASEQQRLEEQRIFRQRLFVISGVVIVFAILILLLIYLARMLRRQKKQLQVVNAEIKRINENLEDLVAERTKLLMEAHKELDTFLYRASHDLRGPVCSIIGLCNLAGHLPEQDSKTIIDRVVHTTIGMDRLLKKLSMISEINEPTNFSTISLLERVDKLRQQFHSFMEVSGISFTVDCPPEIVIDSYPVLIDAILENIVENAIFYAALSKSNDRQVKLQAIVLGDIVEIVVYDNGIGFDQKIQSKLFNMFFKGDVNSKGNGLGLYIVQKSVQALRGDIMVESVLGQFTRVVVHLPLRRDIPPEIAIEGVGQRELLLVQ